MTTAASKVWIVWEDDPAGNSCTVSVHRTREGAQAASGAYPITPEIYECELQD